MVWWKESSERVSIDEVSRMITWNDLKFAYNIGGTIFVERGSRNWWFLYDDYGALSALPKEMVEKIKIIVLEPTEQDPKAYAKEIPKEAEFHHTCICGTCGETIGWKTN